jgi:serine/threonine-protein kinase
VLPRIELVGDQPRLVVEDRRRFEPRKALGEGGAGEVLEAFDQDIGRPVAVKRIRADVKSAWALARFIDEIRTIGRLEHPNIIPIHDVGVDEAGDYYFVMKYVDGETLEDVIAKLREGDPRYHDLYPFERRVQVFRGLLEALAFAHSQGIVHRDIKPANVMVGRFGEVLLMDWGIAKSIRDGDGTGVDEALVERSAEADAGDASRVFRTQVGSIIGTPPYMSPEQAQGRPIDERSDVYSLCILLYEFLSLHHPLADRRTLDEVLHGVIHEAVPMASRLRHAAQPFVPMDLGWFLKRGLEKDPGRRYPSVQAMLDRLDRRAQGIVPIQCHITFAKRLSGMWLRFMDRHPIAFTSILVLGIAGIVAAVAS